MSKRRGRHLLALIALLSWSGAASAADKASVSSTTNPAPVSADESFGPALEAARLAAGTDNYAAAEGDYRAALDVEQRQFGVNSVQVGETLAELALQVSNQERFDEADALFRRAQKIIQTSPDKEAQGRLTSYLALNAANQRHFQDALLYAREVTAQYRAQINEATALAAGGGPPVPTALRADLAHSLRIEAEMALRLGDVSTARAATDEAVWIVNDIPELPLWWRPDVLLLTAEVSEQEGQVVAAERNFHGAIDLDKKIFGDTLPTALSEIELGDFYSRQQVYAPAVSNFRDALAILAKTPRAGAALQPEEVIPLLDAAAADPKLGIDDDAFRAVQMVHADVTDDVIAKMAARKATTDAALAHLIADEEAAQNKRDNLRMALAAEYASDTQDPKQLQTLGDALKTASSDARSLNEQLAKAFPAYASLANPGPAALKDVMRSLAPGEAFVTFVSGTNESVALVVTSESLTVAPLKIKKEEIAQTVADLRGAFVPKLGLLPKFNMKESYGLYRALFAPLEPRLANIRHIVIAPSGELANLPFALLTTAPVRAGDDNAYDRAPWLVRRFAISEVPSARAFLLLRGAQRDRHVPAKPFIGLGDPVFAGSKSDSACVGDTANSLALGQAFPQLPDTRREVTTIATTFGAGGDDVLLGAQANKKDLQSRPLGQFGVLYFATHALLPSELRCQSEPGLVLASEPSGSILYASEISSLRLNADLVVLSACNTAASGGNRYGGGSLEGLADSFFDAGARAVLASHWSVPSKETTALMIKLFELSAQKRNYAEALQQAQLAMIANRATAHPFNWAAFTLLGDGNP
jgi:CHAT domain-containing protein